MATSRTISANFRAQLFAPFRDKDYRILLTVDHPTAGAPFPYRFVSGDPNEFASLTSNGNEFTTFPFEATIPSDDDSEPTANLRLQNADDRIGSTLLALPDEAVTITLQIVLRETPDVIEYEVIGLELVDVVVDAVTVSGQLVMRGSTSEPCPGRPLTSRISPVFFR